MKREVLFEFTPAGATVKVTAVDAETGIEAVIQGPASAGQHALKQAAVKKLQYLLEKKLKKK